jgi:hypothetical protein
MIKDLLKHKDSRDDKPPLVLSAEVPRLRHIEHKRMGYLRATYHLFKETEKDNRALVKARMKMCCETLSCSNTTVRSCQISRGNTN